MRHAHQWLQWLQWLQADVQGSSCLVMAQVCLGLVATLWGRIYSEPTAAGLIFLVGCSSVSIASVWTPCRGCCDKVWLTLCTLLCMMAGVGWLVNCCFLTRLRVTGCLIKVIKGGRCMMSTSAWCPLENAFVCLRAHARKYSGAAKTHTAEQHGSLQRGSRGSSHNQGPAVACDLLLAS